MCHVNNSLKIYGGMFCSLIYNPYLYDCQWFSPRRVRETSSSLRGWTPTCLIVYKSWDVLESTRSPSLVTVTELRYEKDLTYTNLTDNIFIIINYHCMKEDVVTLFMCMLSLFISYLIVYISNHDDNR
jgi:hypothetical protein